MEEIDWTKVRELKKAHERRKAQMAMEEILRQAQTPQHHWNTPWVDINTIGTPYAIPIKTSPYLPKNTAVVVNSAGWTGADWVIIDDLG